MKFYGTIAFAAVGSRLASGLQQPQHVFSNPPASEEIYKIPTPYESAVQARRVLALTPLGTLATIFPQEGHGVSDLEHRPTGLGGAPIGLMEYIADCEDDGNPTILEIKIGTSFKNVRAGSNISLSVQWTPPYPPNKRIRSALFSRFFGKDEKKDPVPFSAANLPRFSIIGYLEKIDDASAASLSSCYVNTHPDAKYWLPGNSIHQSEFVRLVATNVYWIGGFGDRAYIGWLPMDSWRNITNEDWEAIRLPGEKKGWDEWSVKTTWMDL
jgi:hypothetical protein